MENITQELRLGILMRLGRDLNIYAGQTEALLIRVELDHHIIPLFRLLHRARLN